MSVVPIYAGFLVVMAVLGGGAARVAGLETGRARALVFSGATRNSLVVLPLALALPAAYAITPAIVVTQTLVELVGMLVYIRLIPRLVPPTLEVASTDAHEDDQVAADCDLHSVPGSGFIVDV